MCVTFALSLDAVSTSNVTDNTSLFWELWSYGSVVLPACFRFWRVSRAQNASEEC